MRNFDLTNFSRSSVGFEPFLNIQNDIVKKDEANYSIGPAIAGFSPNDTTITARQNLLRVAGRKSSEPRRIAINGGDAQRRLS